MPFFVDDAEMRAPNRISALGRAGILAVKRGSTAETDMAYKLPLFIAKHPLLTRPTGDWFFGAATTSAETMLLRTATRSAVHHAVG
jgi:hypothetical protein